LRIRIKVFEKISADKLSLFDRRYERDRTAPITFMYRPRHMQFPSVGSLLLFQLQEQTIYGHTWIGRICMAC